MELGVAFFLLTFFGMKTCLESTSGKKGRLYGGENIDIKSANFMVQIEKNGEFICGGTIVGSRYVLTAAHCLKKNPKGDTNFTMRFGSGSLKGGGTVLPVGDYQKHPKFNPKTYDYDIAVIILEKDLKYNDSVNCLRRDIKEEDPKLGSAVQVFGWGKSRIGGRFEKFLKVIDMTVTDRDDCFKSYHGRTTARNICSSHRGVALCRGDAGNPLSIGEENAARGQKAAESRAKKEQRLLGVASKIPFFGCNRKGFPFAFTYIKSPEIKSFLEDKVKAFC